MAAQLTLAFVDGFDYYTSGQGQRKWTNGASINTSASGTRFGAGRAFTVGNAAHNLGTSQAAGMIACAWKRASSIGQTLFTVSDNSVTHLTLETAGGGLLQLRRGTGAGTILATSTIPRHVDIWHYIEFAWVVSDAGGAYRVVVDGALDFDGTGADTRNAGTAAWTSFSLDSSIHQFDDLLVKTGATYDTTDDFFGDRRVTTLYPNAAGALAQWAVGAGTGANYLQVDDATADDDTTYLATETVGAIDLYNFDNTPADAAQIVGVQVNVVAKRENSGTPATRTMSVQARSSATDSLSTATVLSSSYVNYRHLMLLDPATAAAWTKAGVDALQAGQKLVA
jgi:hypothetical protein